MLSAEPQQSGMSISGKTVLITGATSGLGLATAMLLAERGAEVVMVGRDRTRSNLMRTEVVKCVAGSAPILFPADLSSQAEIHRLAGQLHGCFSRIDVLINNAAAVFAEREVTPDGLEKTFSVNHPAPFALTHLLFDLLRAAPAGRILTTSSEFHTGELDFSNQYCGSASLSVISPATVKSATQGIRRRFMTWLRTKSDALDFGAKNSAKRNAAFCFL